MRSVHRKSCGLTVPLVTICRRETAGSGRRNGVLPRLGKRRSSRRRAVQAVLNAPCNTRTTRRARRHPAGCSRGAEVGEGLGARARGRGRRRRRGRRGLRAPPGVPPPPGDLRADEPLRHGRHGERSRSHLPFRTKVLSNRDSFLAKKTLTIQLLGTQKSDDPPSL